MLPASSILPLAFFLFFFISSGARPRSRWNNQYYSEQARAAALLMHLESCDHVLCGEEEVSEDEGRGRGDAPAVEKYQTGIRVQPTSPQPR